MKCNFGSVLDSMKMENEIKAVCLQPLISFIEVHVVHEQERKKTIDPKPLVVLFYTVDVLKHLNVSSSFKFHFD